MNIAILGYTDQGKSATHYWNTPENRIVICDSRTDIDLPEGMESHLGDSYLDGLAAFDLIVRAAPSIHPDDIVVANSAEVLTKVTSNTNEFLRVCPTKNVIGVTGTKGKGTTSTLIANMLEAVGKRVHLGGNIGIPPLDLIQNDIREDDWVVLELANFQLIDLKQSPHIAVCLMVVPEHLNWHKDMEEYITAKTRLFTNQLTNDIAIYFGSNELSTAIAASGKGQKVPYMDPPGAILDNGCISISNHEVVDISEIKLLGAHNLQNACAAVTAVWQTGVRDTAAMRAVLTTFTGLEHRLELVRELSGVHYYDDSFGTTPETAIVAMQSFAEPKIIILGGSDKGADYEKLAEAVKTTNVRRALLIGDQAERIQLAFETAGFTDFTPGGTDMGEIVHNAQASAQAGDVVLLSTGCASFGMFQNYKDRGNQFKQAVLALS